MIEQIGITLNSISIICLATTLKRAYDKIIDNQQKLERGKIKQEEQSRAIMRQQLTLEEIKKDLKNTRLEITESASRKELTLGEPEVFTRWIAFYDGTRLPDDFVDYVAKIGLKAIASELPKEKRTHEIVECIIGRMKKELDKKEMLL